MGSVWRAEQVRLRAPVAVKFLDPSLIGDREMHDRFIQEARSAAAVRSAHVVQVFDYGSEGGVPYIAMELLEGENLDARLGARGTPTPAELDRLFTEIARGIGQAHAIDDVTVELSGLQVLEFGRVVAVCRRHQRQAAGRRTFQFHLHLAGGRRPHPELAA